jgi:hypothetical protein
MVFFIMCVISDDVSCHDDFVQRPVRQEFKVGQSREYNFQKGEYCAIHLEEFDKDVSHHPALKPFEGYQAACI